MSGLLFLTSDDFSIQQGDKGTIMCHHIHGLAMILFYSTKCKHCKNLIPIFKKLPGTINGCQFGMINIGTNLQCVELSKNTIVPLKYVPYIVFYINGAPFMIYKGQHDITEIQNFIMEVANNIQKKQKFSKEKVKADTETGIPAYTTGHPVSGMDNRCYLEFMTAYKADSKLNNPNTLPPRN